MTGFIEYPAMLGNAIHQPRIPSGFCCVGSASVRSRAVVRARRIASGRRPRAWRDASRRPPLVSCLAGPRPHSFEGSRPCGAQASARGVAARAGRSGPAQGPRGSWLRDGAVDVAARGHADRAARTRAVPPRSRLVHPAAPWVVTPTSHAAGARARRGGDRAVEARALAAGKKNARRRRAWIVFEDESGVSHRPVVRRTWAPRGHPPVLTHTGGNWSRLSIAAALAFRWDGRRRRCYFQTRPGSYNDLALIGFLRALKRHFPGRHIIVVWDGLGGHTSRVMRQYLAQQRSWVTVERLPGYAPELNPVEQIWGNIKHRELANLCPVDILALRGPLRAGFARIRRRPSLAVAFLRHAGLAF
ncbi:MAG: IS630 family transposase [Candidatus Rokuibacteriota bacterium]|nr:MAG: IS630 family transposase [Candidatus Rokubacteria bacterium]